MDFKTQTMKKYNYVFVLFFISISAISFSQNEFFPYHTSCGNNSDYLGNQDIMHLVSLSDAEYENFTKILRSESEHKSSVITAIGLMVERNNSEALAIIDSLATGPLNRERPSAIRAVLRIGGTSLDRFLDFLFSKDDFEFQVDVLLHVWVIDKLEDLRILEDHLDRVLQEHPDWRINKFASKDFRKRLDTAIRVLDLQETKLSVRELKVIFDFKNNWFNMVPGEIGYMWALRMLNKISNARNELYEYLLNQKEIKKSEALKEGILFYLHTMSYELDESEKIWMKESRTAITSHLFVVFRNAKELREYYSFRQKYPYNPSPSNRKHK